jgi:hypothetical protein
MNSRGESMASTIRQDVNKLAPDFSSVLNLTAPLNDRVAQERTIRRSSQADSGVFDVARAGETSVKLDPALVNALGTLNVSAKGLGTDLSDGIAEFQITGGAADLDTTKVEIIHSGGLSLKSGSTTVDLTDFIITNLGDRAILTGLVTINQDLVTRAPLFDLKIGGVEVSGDRTRSTLDLENVAVTLTSEAANTLNQAFKVSAFTAGFTVGTAEVEASLRQPVRGTGHFPGRSAQTPTVPIHGLPQNTVFDVAARGETEVKLSSALAEALSSLKVDVLGFGRTGLRDGRAEFGITGGAADLDTTKLELIHGGGLSLKAGKTTVDLTDFIISNLEGRTVLTGLVTVNGDLVARASLFDLTVGGVAASGNAQRAVLDLDKVQVSLAAEAATTLNQVFGVQAFASGFDVGTAQAEAVLRPLAR